MTAAAPFLDPPLSPEEIYQSLLRSLRRRKGFGITFIQCSPATAKRLIQRIQENLPQKKIESLELDQPIDNLYNIVANLAKLDDINILFIQGIDKSLESYIRPGYGGEGDYYNLDTVPVILSHLNQQRENFRDDFSNINFVFMLPRFAIRYFIRRAPDFFDWSSGVFKFPTESDLVEHEAREFLSEINNQNYSDLSVQERNNQILKLQELIGEPNQSPGVKVKLLVEQGNLLASSKNYESASANYEEAIKLQPYNHITWYRLGYTLNKLGRYQEAIKSYNKAINIKPEFSEAWQERADVLIELGRDREAIASYEKAIFDLEFTFLLNQRNAAQASILSFVNNLLQRFKLNDIDADEILNEVYLRGFRAIKSGRAFKNLPVFIRHTALNIIQDRFMQRHNLYKNFGQLYAFFYEQLLISSDSLPAIIAEEADTRKLLQDALERLEPIDRNLIGMRFIEGLSLSEMAEKLQGDGTVINQSTLSRRIQRALQRLRKTFDSTNTQPYQSSRQTNKSNGAED